MIDLFCIFSTGGLILWYKSFVSSEFADLINLLIKNILLDEKRTQEFYLHNGNVMRWKVINNAGLIFVVSYQESYNVLYVDVLLDLVVKDFTENHLASLKKKGKIYLESPNYSETFVQLLKKWERYCQEKIE
jgi:hypothetical protein